MYNCLQNCTRQNAYNAAKPTLTVRMIIKWLESNFERPQQSLLDPTLNKDLKNVFKEEKDLQTMSMIPIK